MYAYIRLVFLIGFSALMLVSCKSKAVVLSEGKARERLSSDTIIKKHYANSKDFSTVYIKANAHYEDANQSQRVNAEIKIKKDQKILISIRVLGITMAKALITPTEVKYYEKINSQYFEGDYTLLSRWLGTDLDFYKVQNLLLGHAIDDLAKGNYTASIENTLYKLDDNTDASTSKAFYFESGKFLLKREVVSQPAKNRMVQILYPNYADSSVMVLPTNLEIEAAQKKGKVNIEIEYNSVSFNEDLSFPYSVPEGYERIFIN